MAHTKPAALRRIFIVDRQGGTAMAFSKENIHRITVEETDADCHVVVIEDVYGGTHSFGTNTTRDQANDLMSRLAAEAAKDGESVVSTVQDEEDAAK